MKRNPITIGLTLLSVFFLMLSFSSGPGTSEGLRVTGAPGDGGNCGNSGCHGGHAFSQSTSIKVTDANNATITNYIPGETYQVEVRIAASQGTPSAYGFQMIALFNSNNNAVNSWTDIPSGIQKVSLNGRDYVEHAGPNSQSNTFNVKWIAPESGKGDVTFYTAGNAVNRNGSSSGDDPAVASLIVKEAIASSINDITSENFVVYPNPTSSLLNLELKEGMEGQYEIVDMIGRRILKNPINDRISSIDISLFNKGIYLLRLLDENGQVQIVKKIVKE